MKTNIEELKISNDGYSQNIVFYENKIKEQDSKIFNLETELKHPPPSFPPLSFGWHPKSC